MRKFFFRFKAAFTAAKTAFVHPDIMVSAHFSVMASMYENILKVQERKSPLMFQIGIVFPGNERHAIATVWVGAGADSSPVKRIEQLFHENEALRKIISDSGNQTNSK